MCPASVGKKSLAEVISNPVLICHHLTIPQHLRKIHGNGNSVVQVSNQATSGLVGSSVPVESAHATPIRWVPGEARYPSIWTATLPQSGEDPSHFGTHNLPLQRFYCPEHDCGRGFSSEVHLETHARFFHPKKVEVIFSLGSVALG
jgi:hypothetical protein